MQCFNIYEFSEYRTFGIADRNHLLRSHLREGVDDCLEKTTRVRLAHTVYLLVLKFSPHQFML